MSHLRPTDPVTHKPKAYADYTLREKESAYMQLCDEILRRQQSNPPCPVEQSLARLAVQMAEGTEKEESIDPLIIAGCKFTPAELDARVAAKATAAKARRATKEASK